ncbi:family 43 glycoside hydrolase [Melampsora larici-populina 98AG31]|uniref:Family 43 glycoside hydrolase n=1 Tax=Melampsora larici-populina (strain 98AG31 / pathotype 3-4-7) TaxID=747676 RepID=F4RKR6_MELLP|nr:family 43 glycoside hydrolase [Melampsora larici-populina 98AG31]EGG06775.1 family 43 glycoside hydrolase [Melampsora larici-populina 98AG31]
MDLRSLIFGFLLFALIVTGQRKRIVSGAIWNDDAGNRIQAHGGSLLQRGNEWSNDLVTWTRLPNVLVSEAGTPLNGDMVVERPRVLFNQATNKFVMYFHYDDSNVFSKTFPDKLLDLWIQKIPSSEDSNANLKLARLSKDYVSDSFLKSSLGKTGDGCGGAGLCMEAGVLGSDRCHQGRRSLSRDIFTPGDYPFKIVIRVSLGTDGNSEWGFTDVLKKGWSANPNKVVRASNLAGPWSDALDIADPQLNTYSSQNTYELTVTGTQATTHICGTYRTGQIGVNGGGKSNVYYPPTSALMSIPVPVTLALGNDNVIDLGIPSGVVVDHIIVY